MAFAKNARIQKYSEIIQREGHKIFKLWASGIRSKQIVSIANKIIQDKGLKNNFNRRFKALAFAFALNLRVKNRYSNIFKKLFHLFSYLSERAVLRKLNIALGYDENLQLKEIIGVEIESLEARLSKRNDWNSNGGVKVSVAYDMTIEQELLLFLEREDVKEGKDKENLGISEGEENLSESSSANSKHLKEEKEIDLSKDFISFEGAELASNFNLPQDNANKERNFNSQNNQIHESSAENAFKNGEVQKGAQGKIGDEMAAKLAVDADIAAKSFSNGGKKQSASNLPPLKGEGQGRVDLQNQTQTNKNPQHFTKGQSSQSSQETNKTQPFERVKITEDVQTAEKTRTQSKAQPLVTAQETEVKDARRIYIEKREAEMEEIRRLAHPVFKPEQEKGEDYKPHANENKKQEIVKPQQANDNNKQEVIKPKERVEISEKEVAEKISEENLARRELNNSMSKEQIHALAEQIKEQANIVMEQEEAAWRERIVVKEEAQAQQNMAYQPPQVQQGGAEIQNNRK